MFHMTQFLSWNDKFDQADKDISNNISFKFSFDLSEFCTEWHKIIILAVATRINLAVRLSYVQMTVFSEG